MEEIQPVLLTIEFEYQDAAQAFFFQKFDLSDLGCKERNAMFDYKHPYKSRILSKNTSMEGMLAVVLKKIENKYSQESNDNGILDNVGLSAIHCKVLNEKTLMKYKLFT